MGIPSINIVFSEAAAATAAASGKGIVALIVKDINETGGHTMTRASQIPSKLTESNKEYIKRAFIGYEKIPSKVLLYVIDSGENSEETLDTALDYFATQRFDWLAAMPDVSAAECKSIAEWIDAQRDEYHAICKAVLPNYAADSDAVCNFTGQGYVGDKALSPGELCSRIAGILAGTPFNMSATYAPINELSDIVRLKESEANTKTDNGELILLHDGEKVKLGRAVTSLKTLTAQKGASCKKVHIVDLKDRMDFDLRQLSADTIGKYSNSYDNQCILLTAISSYMERMEADGLVKNGWSVAFDLEAKAAWLEENGVDISVLDEDAIRQHESGSHVFIVIRCKLLDTIEDIAILINI